MRRLITRTRQKLQRSGVRATLAAALRHAANRVESKRPGSRDLLTNEFLSWVRFAIPGMLDSGNVDAMAYALANMPQRGAVLEIGSFCGLSTVVLSYFLEKAGATIPFFSCDSWEFEGQQLGSFLGDSPSVTHDTYRTHVRNTFLQTMKTFSPARLPHTIECVSDEFFRRWFANAASVDVFGRAVTFGAELTFCYIDGNHSYAFAKRDFDNTDRALVSGGFILFDDSADGSGWEVNRLTREIASGRAYELVGRYPNYLFKKK